LGSDASKGIGLRVISIAVVIALIVGAGIGYMVSNSLLTSLMKERDGLEAESAFLQGKIIVLQNQIDALEDEIDELNRQPYEPPDEPPSKPPEPEGIYVGSINSNKYHLPSCYWAGQINKSNEIWFTSKSDAESHGYVPCKVCEP